MPSPRATADTTPAGASEDRPLNVGLVGCGRIARMFHLPVLRDHPGTHLLAVADPDASARQAAVAACSGVLAVGDLDTLLAEPGLDAVVVCAPTHLHEAVAVAAFGAGLHVYVEKPLAPDLDAAGRIRDASRGSGRTGVVGFGFRSHPLHLGARRTIAAGGLGELVGARSVFASSPRDLPAWKRDRATGGGALLDLATHHLDLWRYLLDTEVTTVTASTGSIGSGDDTVALTLGLARGIGVQSFATLRAAQVDRIEVFGDRATLELDRMGRRRATLTPVAAPGTSRERLAAAGRVVRDGALATLDGLRPPGEPSFATALGAFVTAASTGRPDPALATIDDGYEVARLVDAAERAAVTGTTVTVDPAGADAGATR